MAQAYEYALVENTDRPTFLASVASYDADGWEVVGFAAAGSNLMALVRRRV